MNTDKYKNLEKSLMMKYSEELKNSSDEIKREMGYLPHLLIELEGKEYEDN